MTFPNFLIIGAAKSGTTALYRYIRQHPQIYMSPVKEPHFFGYEGAPPNSQGPGDFVNTAITNLDEYLRLFDGVKEELAIGEASPTYLYLPKAVERIHFYLPDVKLIAILRQPADRAYSAYMHVIRDQREVEYDFAKALELEQDRIDINWGPIWHFKKMGCYSEQLARYFKLFAKEQLRVYLYDDFSANSLGILGDIFRFLGVDDKYKLDTRLRPNVSGVQKNQIVARLIDFFFSKPNPVRYFTRKLLPEQIRWQFTTAVRNRNILRPAMSPKIRMELTEYFRPDIIQLEELIDRDLSHWLVE